jgi:hypothetical protein
MQLVSESAVEYRNGTTQVSLNDGRTEAVVVPGTCCCTAAIAR